MKRLVAGRKHRQILFSDEKIFTMEPIRNQQNHREWLLQGSPRTVNVQKSHFPKSIMVWAGVSALGNTKLHFFDQKKRFNAVGYQTKILEGVMKPWAKKNTSGIQWIYQQDGAPTHSANTTLNWFHDPTKWSPAPAPVVWDKNIWPPHSPDLNPLDFSVWSILGEKISGKRFETVESLKRALQKAWKEISSELTIRIVDQFPKRFQACINAEGGHFKQCL
ncbi:hypothetical protein L596_020172 [Steinernema carpocapsae]|uniref:Tc1-like transposase DDE domain-containing protein n=1 Tax=Steinernema carpocapsae TaxID=34508 RepID=A0A4U5MSY4_STECR|nr:hypothetical protein L596_020172 [Steinernema carpocapsae]